MSIENYAGFMNASLDSLEYSPDFIQLPTANYVGTIVKCEFGEREARGEDVVTVELHVRIDQVLEDSISPEGIVGNVAGYTFFGEAGITNGFAKVFADSAAQLGASTVAELVAALAAGVQIEFTNVKRAGKKPAEGEEQKYFYNIKSAILV
jgi:hypothetical protein